MNVRLGGGNTLLGMPESPSTRERRAPLRARLASAARRHEERRDELLLAALARFQTREAIEEALAPALDDGEYGISVFDRWGTFDAGVVVSERRRIELLTHGDYTLLVPDQNVVLGVNMATVMPEAHTVVFNTSNQYRYRGCAAEVIATLAVRQEELYYAPGQPGSFAAAESFDEAVLFN
jgi:hypothetical protein